MNPTEIESIATEYAAKTTLTLRTRTIVALCLAAAAWLVAFGLGWAVTSLFSAFF